MLPDFSYSRPASVQDAVSQLSFESVPYVGGTELLLAMRMGLLRPDCLVDLKRIPELQTIELRDSELVIGAAATHDQIAKNELVLEHASILAEVENRVGNARVRAAGSIGGNLSFAEPRSDVAAILIALGAGLTLVSPRGSRTISVDDFTQGPYTTQREDDELITSIHVPLDPARRGVYLKYQTMERPTLGVALVESTRTGSASRVLVVGAVGGRPQRLEAADSGTIDPQTVADTVEIMPDLTGSVTYKRHVVAVYVQRALDALKELEA